MVTASKILLGFLIGVTVGAGSILLLSKEPGINKDWMELLPKESAIGYSSEALFGVDISLPEVKNLGGKGKFLEPTDPAVNDLQLGYKITTTVESLDTANIPEQYRVARKSVILSPPLSEERRAQLDQIVRQMIANNESDDNIQLVVDDFKQKYGEKGAEVEIPPVEEVVYQVHFEFDLRDEDDFVLTSLGSESHTIRSGQENSWQSIAEGRIPRSVAARTQSISLAMTVDQCNTCR